MTRSVDVRITGTVQGVSFRAYAQREAARLGVAGWVRNEPDGSVAAHVEGANDQVAELLEWCRHGSPGAHVETVDVCDAPTSGGTTFEIVH